MRFLFFVPPHHCPFFGTPPLAQYRKRTSFDKGAVPYVYNDGYEVSRGAESSRQSQLFLPLLDAFAYIQCHNEKPFARLRLGNSQDSTPPC